MIYPAIKSLSSLLTSRNYLFILDNFKKWILSLKNLIKGMEMGNQYKFYQDNKK